MSSIGSTFKDEAYMSKNDQNTLPKRLQPRPVHHATPVKTPAAPARSTSPDTMDPPGNGGGLDGLGGGRLL
jgi:hypothetical protein